MNKLFVIILNFNNKKDIILCLQSLIKAYSKINVVVVDNGSSDGSVELIKAKFLSPPRSPFPPSSRLRRAGGHLGGVLKLIKNKENLGFAKGINKGIEFALKQGAESILLLNPDTEVTKGFLELLLTNKADIVGPIIKFKRKGEWIYDFGGKINFWLGRVNHDESSNPKAVFGQPDYLSGCCLLIERRVFEKIGLLNEKYFLFFEDSDFCLKAKRAGFKVALEPKSMILHKLSEGKKKPLYCLYHLIRSNLIFVNTWLPFYRRPLAYLYLMALSFKMLLNRL